MRRNPAEVCASPKPGEKRRVESQEGHPARKKKPPQTHMSHNNQKTIPDRTPPGQARKRSALAVKYPGGISDKLAMGSNVRLRVGSVNVGTMWGRSGEIVEMMERRRLDFCCLQETRWKGGSARTMGSCKFFWIGCEEGISGVLDFCGREMD